MATNLYDAALLKELGIEDLTAPTDTSFLQELGLAPEEEEKKRILDFAEPVLQPIRGMFGATGGVGGAALGQLAPEAYTAAKQKLAEGLGVTADSSLMQRAEALPGAGDVLAELVPESISGSLPGRMVGPVGRMAGNILGDPTTYTPFVMGKAGNLIVKGIKEAKPAIEAAETALRAAEIASQNTNVAVRTGLRAGLLSPEQARGLTQVAQKTLAQQRADTAAAKLLAVSEFGTPLQAKAYRTAAILSEIDTMAQGTAAAIAYGPQVGASAWNSLQDALSADSLSEGLVSGANAVLMAGMGVLMGKGLVSAAKAKDVLARAVADQSGLKVPGKAAPEPVLPSERAEAFTTPEAPPAEAPVVTEEARSIAGEMVAQREEAADARREAVLDAIEEVQGTPIPRTEVLPEVIEAPRQAEVIPPLGPRTETLPETPTVEAPAQQPTRPVEAPPEVPVKEAAPVEAPAPAEVTAPEQAPAPPVPVDFMSMPDADLALDRTVERLDLSPEQQAAVEARVADPTFRAALNQRVQAAVEGTSAKKAARAAKDTYFSIFKELGEEARKPAAEVAPEAPVREAAPAEAPPPAEIRLSETAQEWIRQIEAERDRALKQAKNPAQRDRISQRAQSKINEITSKALKESGVKLPPAESGTIGHRRAGIEVAEREEAAGKQPQVGAEKVKPADRRVWGVIPDRAGVLERFYAAKKGEEIKGKSKKWKVDVNLPRMQRFVELLNQTGARDQAIKLLAKERKSAVAAERNFVKAFEDSLGEFHAGELGIRVPERVQAPAAAEQLKERKLALDARIPKTGEGDDPAEVASLLKEYARFVLERKATPGLYSKDPLMKDKSLQDFGKRLGLKIPTGTNALEVVRQISHRLGLNTKEILAETEKVAVKASRPVAPKAVPVRFQQKLEGKGVGARSIWIGQGAKLERFADGEEFRLTEVKDPAQAIADLNELVATPGVKVIHIDPDMKQRDVQKLVDAVVQNPDGNTKAAWEVDLDGEKIIPVKKASAEVEAPRIEAAQVRKATPDSELSVAHRRLRAEHYVEDAESGIPLGENTKVVDHDRVMGREYAQKVVEVGKGVANEVHSITDELSEIHDENIEFGGLTASPYLSGLYHNGKLYVNLVEAVHAAKTREQAAENIIYTLIHEAAHAQGVGHDQLHGDYARLIKQAAEAEGRIKGYRERLLKALPEDVFKRIQDELVPEFRSKWEEINGESWRKDQQGVPARDVASGAAAGAYRASGRAEVAPGGRAAGVQPGGAVPGGTLGEAGGVRPAAAAGRGAAPGATQTEAVGPAAGREAGAEESRIEVLETREGAGGRRGVTLASAKEVLDSLLESVERKKMPRGMWHERAWELAGQVVDGMSMDELAKAAVSKPGGVSDAVLNLGRLTGLSERVKAQTKVWGDLTEGKWARDKVEHWSDLGEEVHRLLGLDTPESYMAAIKRKGALTSQDVLMLRTISNEMGARIEEARNRYYEGIADPKLSDAQKKGLEKEWRNAEWEFRRAALATSEGLTGVARALASAKAELIRMDPRAQFEQEVLAALREKTRQRFPGDAVAAEEKATELFKKLMDVFSSKDAEGRSDQAFAEFRKAYSLLLKRGSWDKTLEWYKMGLLGWPSQVANASGNTIFRMSRFVEDLVAGGLDMAKTTFQPGREREIYVGESSAAMLGMRRAFMEALPQMTNEVTRLFQLKGPSLDAALNHLKHGALSEDILSQAGGAIAGRFGNFVRFQADMMGAMDDLGKHVAMMDSLYRQVYRKVRKGEAGFEIRPGESKTAAVERLVSDFRTNHKNWASEGDFDVAKMKQFEPMLETARETAKRDTFQEDVPGWLRGMQTMIQRNPWMQVLVPFFRTPTNIAKETIRRTPLGLVEVFHKWKGMSEAERISALSRPVTGSLYMLGLGAIASAGGVTGGGPTNPEEQDALKATGWQPYSIRVGNQWLSYQRLEPIASLLGFAADYTEAIRRGEAHDLRGMAEKTFTSLTENLTNKTFLSTLMNLSSAVSDPQRYGQTFVKQLQGGMVPNSIGFVPVGHLARAIDPVYRETQAFSMNPFLAKVPGVSATLAPQYGPTGEERVRKGSFVERLVSPYARSVQEDGPKTVGTEELIRLGAVPKTPMRYWLSPQGVQVPLKPEERKQLAKSMNKAVLTIGSQLVKDPTYRRLPDNEDDPNYQLGMKTKEDVVRKMLNRYRAEVMAHLKPQLKARLREQFRKREITA